MTAFDTTERVVPGLPGMLKLVAPETFDRYVLEVRQTPPSMNDPASGWKGNWRAGNRLKRDWQNEIEGELLTHAVRRGNLRAIAGASMRFPKRGRRDSGNFTMIVEKALGDALVNGGWIPDDDAERFFFAGVEFEQETGPERTTIVVFLQPEG